MAAKPAGAAHRRNRSEPINPIRLPTTDLAIPPRHGHSPLGFRVHAADWTRRSTKLLVVALAALVLVVIMLTPPEPEAGSADLMKLREAVWLHQTVRSLNLSTLDEGWRHSWEHLGFRLNLADDAQCSYGGCTASSPAGQRR